MTQEVIVLPRVRAPNVCTGCGWRCTKSLGFSGRLLEDENGHLYKNSVRIEDCRVSQLINDGLSQVVARAIVNKGERII